MLIKAFVFDLFNTLIDIQSISKAFAELDVISGLVMNKLLQTWHTKQLQHAWLLTIMNRFETFSDISLRALRYTTKSYGIQLTQEQTEKILKARLSLELFPDSKKGIEDLRIKRNKIYLAVLSNGEKPYLDAILTNTGLQKYFDFVISVEEIRKYKPSPQVYFLAAERLNLPISEIVLVSSNTWDIAGAKAVGMQTCWINRKPYSIFEEIDLNLNPDYFVSSIEDLNQI